MPTPEALRATWARIAAPTRGSLTAERDLAEVESMHAFRAWCQGCAWALDHRPGRGSA